MACLNTRYNFENDFLEIGVDEAGRGPMLGRVYSAAVILPTNSDDFKHEWMKDSKKFHSEKKIKEMANYIKENAIAWGVGYSTEEEIDFHNIKVATHLAMHKAIKSAIHMAGESNPDSVQTQDFQILVDGRDFKTYNVVHEERGLIQIPHVCIEGGDNKYTAIAAGSILAKVARDEYIDELCENDNTLDERYDLKKNKGYGTKLHMEGIKKYGISTFHRKTFGICRNYAN